MATKRILLFNGARLTAHLWHSGQLRAEGEFLPQADGADGADGFIAFAVYLHRHRTSLFYFLADIADESFQLEEIPSVHGRDRTALITRRLKQQFYGTPLTTALKLGRSNEGRRDEKMLFAALTRPEAINLWLDVIQQNGIILAGIYSAPLILAECAPRWLADEQPTLLISQTASGVRQSFFNCRKLQFSRLTPLTTLGALSALGTLNTTEEIARKIVSESLKTYQYLVGQRQLKPNTPMRVTVLVTAEQKTVVQTHCQNQELLQFDFLDLETIAQHDKLKSPPNTLTTDQLLMHWLVIKTPTQQFAPPAERHFYRLWQIRLALTAVATITLASGLLFAVKTAFDTARLQQETSTAQSQTALATQRYNALLDSLPKTSITPENLRALMNRYEVLQKRAADLTPLLTHLSQTLDATPPIELINLDWKVEPTLNAALSNTQKLGAGDTPQSLEFISGKSPWGTVSPTGNASNNASSQANMNLASNGPWATLKIQAQLPLGLSADLRAQKELIDTFAQRLQDPQTKVYLLAMPFDVESGKPLKSMQEADDGRSESAPAFSLMIARPL